MEDDKIIDLYIARDENAIHQTSMKYGKSLRLLADKVCDDLSTAEECENDTYMRAWSSIPPHEPRNYFFSYLAKITRCLAIDRVKAMTRQRRNADFVELTQEMESCIPAPDSTASQLEGEMLSRLISDFLRTQNEEKRNVFIRRYWFMDSVAEVAKRFSISEGKVKTILFRVRNELRLYLEKEGYHI